MTTEVNAAAVGTARDETPLTRVPEQGSAREGAHHWWEERMSALATFLLFVWFGVSLLRLGTIDHATLTEWLSSPFAAVPMLLLIVATFWHIRMGLQVIVDDYVHDSASRLFWTMLISFGSFLGGAFAAFAVLKIALGAAA
jgi:succinate dehydrogenase / fumarate reductase membrane anchor subunit